MAGIRGKNTHPPLERLKMREDIAHAYLRGKTLNAIAQDYGVSRPRISQIMAEIREEWINSSIRDFDAARAKEIAKIDALESEYWKAWEESKTPEEVKTTEAVAGDTNRTRKATKSKHRTGNPAFLLGVERCISARSKLLGLDQPRTEEKGPTQVIIQWGDAQQALVAATQPALPAHSEDVLEGEMTDMDEGADGESGDR